MNKEKITHISEGKKKIVNELANLIKSKRTILLASIKNLPANQFQEICKKLRGKAVVKVVKKNLVLRALENSGEKSAKKLEGIIDRDIAILFSDVDAFELAAELIDNKIPTKAKQGQEAPEDIEVKSGPTNLTPGPAVSELGAMGIQIKIEGGKIIISKPKIIAKKGEKISQKAVDIMNKLDIKPFSISFVPLAAIDTKEDKLYNNISIDKEKTLKELKEAYSKALAFAIEIGYTTKETIGLLIRKAEKEALILKKYEPNTLEKNNSGEEN